MLTADDLVSKVLIRCFWPTSNAHFSTAEILSIADDELKDSWADVLKANGKYYVQSLDHTIVAAYNRYRLPPKAYGPLLDVLIVRDDGEEVSVPELDLQELGYQHRSRTRSGYRHFIEGDFLGLTPTPEGAGTLRIKFYRHPSQLCLAGATVGNVSSALDFVKQPNRITLESALTPTPSAGDLWDVVSAGNAHQLLLDGGEIDTVTGGGLNLNFTDSLNGSGIFPGDWVAPAGFSPVVQLPDYMESTFIDRVAQVALEAADDEQAAEVVRRRAALKSERATGVGIPRSEAEPRTARTRNSLHRMAR